MFNTKDFGKKSHCFTTNSINLKKCSRKQYKPKVSSWLQLFMLAPTYVFNFSKNFVTNEEYKENNLKNIGTYNYYEESVKKDNKLRQLRNKYEGFDIREYILNKYYNHKDMKNIDEIGCDLDLEISHDYKKREQKVKNYVAKILKLNKKQKQELLNTYGFKYAGPFERKAILSFGDIIPVIASKATLKMFMQPEEYAYYKAFQDEFYGTRDTFKQFKQGKLQKDTVEEYLNVRAKNILTTLTLQDKVFLECIKHFNNGGPVGYEKQVADVILGNPIGTDEMAEAQSALKYNFCFKNMFCDESVYDVIDAYVQRNNKEKFELNGETLANKYIEKDSNLVTIYHIRDDDILNDKEKAIIDKFERMGIGADFYLSFLRLKKKCNIPLNPEEDNYYRAYAFEHLQKFPLKTFHQKAMYEAYKYFNINKMHSNNYIKELNTFNECNAILFAKAIMKESLTQKQQQQLYNALKYVDYLPYVYNLSQEQREEEIKTNDPYIVLCQARDNIGYPLRDTERQYLNSVPEEQRKKLFKEKTVI